MDTSSSKVLDQHFREDTGRLHRNISIRYISLNQMASTIFVLDIDAGPSTNGTHLRNQALRLRLSDYSPAIDNLFKSKKNRASLSTYTF